MARYGRDVDSRTETQSIESHAAPEAILALLADPSRIPEWAPAFVDAVIEDGESGWRATKGGQDFILRVVTTLNAGTVDYLREIAPDREGGAYMRPMSLSVDTSRCGDPSMPDAQALSEVVRAG